MKNDHQHTWAGIRATARARLETRNYSGGDPMERLGSTGLASAEAVSLRDELAEAWIPGVEFIPRRVFQQKDRGYFAELARTSEGVLASIGLVPQQWSAALMHYKSAKGFHIHPPFVPEGRTAAEWFRELYLDHPGDYSMRPYDREQWDVMFFLTSICELLLVDEREGLPRRVMRVTIDGDSLPGAGNVAVIIPPGVAHALRNIGNTDLAMVYGTSTTFEPDWEGRLGSEVEQSRLPAEWDDYLATPPGD
ncbi:MAG: hypothetical protein HKN82_02345 [Akkermansiaceae bacterium]|nr:hypothetical protein [Akkermansiaceae bacterium]NNM28967.1 hypothetical protein [Akkermansiaceae bacterium]